MIFRGRSPRKIVQHQQITQVLPSKVYGNHSEFGVNAGQRPRLPPVLDTLYSETWYCV